MTIDDETTEFLTPIFASVAKGVWSCNKGYVDRDDLTQECWMWFLSTPSRQRQVAELLADDKPKLAAKVARRGAWAKCQQVARAEKAAKGGFSVEDEAFYSPSLLMQVLPAVLNDDPSMGRLKEDGSSAAREPGEIVAKTDPAEGNTWLAMLADVSRAWSDVALDYNERLALDLWLGQGHTQTEIARSMDVAQQTVSRMCERALRRLCEALGGDDPWVYSDPTDEALRERPGVHSGRSGMEQEVTA